MSDASVHTLVVSCLVRNINGEVLLIKHHRRGWELPGGRVETDEDLLTALKREVAEESGVMISVLQPIVFHSKVDDPPALIAIFSGEAIGGVLRTSQESVAVGWFTPNDALKLVEHPAARDRLVDALSYSGDMVYRSYTTSPYSSKICCAR